MSVKRHIKFDHYTNLPLGGNWAGDWPAYVLVHHEGAVDDVRYVPERTCLWNGGCGLGVYVGPYDEDTGAYDLPSTIEAHHLTCGHTAYTEGEIPGYCPNCGARIVKEEA